MYTAGSRLTWTGMSPIVFRKNGGNVTQKYHVVKCLPPKAISIYQEAPNESSCIKLSQLGRPVLCARRKNNKKRCGNDTIGVYVERHLFAGSWWKLIELGKKRWKIFILITQFVLVLPDVRIYDLLHRKAKSSITLPCIPSHTLIGYGHYSHISTVRKQFLDVDHIFGIK
jgi:hypothetical protein